jgi:anti-sigma regulatory factor (Ser/Thr protein kinase)
MTSPPDLEISIPARAENVSIVRHVLGGLGDALGLDPEVLADIKLAVSEACANVVVHAYPDDGGGLLDLDVTAGERTLGVVVRDHGRGMAPRADSPGLGVGLPLIASLAETLELSNGTDGGTEVRMTFALEPVKGSATRDAAYGRHARTGAGGPSSHPAHHR